MFDSVGGYNRSTGWWHLRDTICDCWQPINFRFDVAVPGPHLPIAGDWNGDGLDGVGVYTPANGTFYLRDDLTTGGAQYTFAFGGAQPARYARAVAGDWDGDGKDSVGLYRTDTGRWRLRNTLDAGPPTALFTYDRVGTTERPIAGDWDGNGTSTPGLMEEEGIFYLRNANSQRRPRRPTQLRRPRRSAGRRRLAAGRRGRRRHRAPLARVGLVDAGLAPGDLRSRDHAPFPHRHAHRPRHPRRVGHARGCGRCRR